MFIFFSSYFFRLAADFGLKLIRKTRFDDFFYEFSEVREHRNLLGKMQALEVMKKVSDILKTCK